MTQTGLKYMAILAAVWASAAPVLVQAQATQKRPVARSSVILIDPSAVLAPFSSPRPTARPSRQVAGIKILGLKQAITEDISRKPKAAKEQASPVAAEAQKTARAVISGSPFAVARSLKPTKRPKKLRVASIDPKPEKVGKPVRYRKKGSVCGIKGIRGYSVKRVQGKISGCRIDNPVKISEIDGIKLTKEALVGCDAAKSLYSWVHNSAKPTIGRRGGGLSKIQLVVSYACRNRNSAKNGKLSEHAKGKAMDITGFVLKNGDTLSVLKDWRSASKGKTLKKLHKTACGPFGTVLGPNANRYHRDHFHFDVASYRKGAYCR